MSKKKKAKIKKKKSSKIRNEAPMDLASFEAMLSGMFTDSDEETPLREAQDMMYDACNSGTLMKSMNLDPLTPSSELP